MPAQETGAEPHHKSWEATAAMEHGESRPTPLSTKARVDMQAGIREEKKTAIR
jgi:hypothetical protein